MEKLSPKKYVITKAHSLPFHECLINETWKENGMPTVWVSKKMPSGKLIVGVYMIDVLCLGIKDSLFRSALDSAEYDEFKDGLSQQGNLIPIEVSFTHNLIYGAIDFAQDNGFKPHNDFSITQHLLDESLIDDGIDEIEFGRNGRPVYLMGPYDDSDWIIKTLNKNLGAGNFDVLSKPDDFDNYDIEDFDLEDEDIENDDLEKRL